MQERKISEQEVEKRYEKLLNIHTTGRDDSHADTYRYPYEPTPYVVLERLANRGYLGKKNALLDYGCGKGRVGLFLSYQTRCASIGIEYENMIYQTALKNKETAVSGARVQFVLADAAVYTVAPEIDRCFFFNPFSVEILRSVMGNILDSYYENPREILLMFYFPSDEYVSYLMTKPELDFVDEIECDDLFEEEKHRERILIFEVTG